MHRLGLVNFGLLDVLAQDKGMPVTGCNDNGSPSLWDINNFNLDLLQQPFRSVNGDIRIYDAIVADDGDDAMGPSVTIVHHKVATQLYLLML